MRDMAVFLLRTIRKGFVFFLDPFCCSARAFLARSGVSLPICRQALLLKRDAATKINFNVDAAAAILRREFNVDKNDGNK
jgi:hypothetical protein